MRPLTGTLLPCVMTPLTCFEGKTNLEKYDGVLVNEFCKVVVCVYANRRCIEQCGIIYGQYVFMKHLLWSIWSGKRL